MKKENIKYTLTEITWAFIYAAIAVALACILASCSTTHKTKSTASAKTESAQSAAAEKETVSKTENTSSKEKDSTYTDNSAITINFDNTYNQDNGYTIHPGFDFGYTSDDPVNDYAGAPSNPKPLNPKPLNQTYTYDIAGTQIKSSVRIKDINLVNKKTGQLKAIEIVTQNKIDSSTSKAKISTQSKTEIQVVQQEKKKTSYVWLGMVIVGCIAAGLLYQIPLVQDFIWWFLALFGRKKKQNNNT